MATPRWREPTFSLPLRWGTYRGRYLAGLLLIVGGAIQLQGSNTRTLPLLLIGTTAHAVGWSIIPQSGGAGCSQSCPQPHRSGYC